MKKVKKIFRLGKMRKEQQQSLARSRTFVSVPALCTSSLDGGGGRSKMQWTDQGRMHQTAAEGNLRELRHLLKTHDLNEQDKAGRTPLLLACTRGHTDIVNFLVENKCQLNICDSNGTSPLMKAVECQQEFCAIYLLEHGADPNLADMNNNTALHFAASGPNISIAKHLLDHKAYIEARNKDGSTPLIIAMAGNNQKMVAFLLKEGASAPDNLGRNPLSIAISNKKHDLTNVLLTYGSDAFHKDNSGQTKQDYMAHSGDSILQHLVESSVQEKKAEDSSDDQQLLSILSIPDRAGDPDVALGAPVTNKEEAYINEHLSGDSLRDSDGLGNDAWLSSEENELELNPKNPQKPCVAQLFKKYFREYENDQSLEENTDSALQKNICPTKQEVYNPNDFCMDHKEAEFDEEGNKEEVKEKGNGNEEDEKVEEEDFSEEWGDENKEESQGKVEHGEEEYLEKVEKREIFTDNKCDKGNDLSSSDKETCNESDEETQEAHDMPRSFIARRRDCSNENAVFNKVNDELSHDSFEKENSYKHDHQFQNTNGSQGTEKKNRIAHENEKGCHRNIFSSVNTFEMTALAGSALPSAINSHDNKDMISDWSDSLENDYSQQIDTAWDIYKIIQQNSENPVDYHNDREEQCMNTKELGNAIHEQLVLKSENNQGDAKLVPPEINASDSRVEDSPEEEEKEKQEDKKEEDGKNPNVVNINSISYKSTQNQISTQDGGVRKATLVLGVDEEEKKDKESPWAPELEEEGEEELEEEKEAAATEKMFTHNEQKREQKSLVKHSKMENKMEHVLAEESQVTNPICSTDREGFLPSHQKGMNSTASITDERKSKNKCEISTIRVDQQVSNQQLQDDSSLSEAVPEEKSVKDVPKSANKSKISAGRVSQQITEKLHQLQDESSLNETSSEEEKMMGAAKSKNKGQIITKCEKLRELQDDSEASLEEERFSLKQEKEKRVCAETLYEKTQEQLRRKEQQYCELMVEKQKLEFVLRSMKMELKTLKIHLKQLQGSEEQCLQSKRHIFDLKNALEAKEQEASVISHQLQTLLVKLSEANSTIKQLEGHKQRLETEKGRLEATANQQANNIAALQNDLQESVLARNQLEEVIAGLPTEKISLEEQLNQQGQEQTAMSVSAQDSHIWVEQLKPQSKLRIHLSKLDREREELMAQFENERKKVKKLVEFKRSVEMRLDQERKRSNELKKKCNGIKRHLKTATKKLKEYESGTNTSQTRFREDARDKYSKIGTELGELRKKKSFACPLTPEEETSKQENVIDLSQMQQYKKSIEEQAKQEIRQKLQEVNLFLQTQASSQETLEQIRAANNASLINQLETIVRGLESELSQLKSQLQECALQNESMHTELTKYKDLYLEELKMRKSLGNKLVWSNEKLAETKAKLFHERYRSKSLLASSFLSGSLSASPILEAGQLGRLGNNRTLDRPCTPVGFRKPIGSSPLASKSRVEAWLAKMQKELEKNIRKELDQAKSELDARCGRVSPIGLFNGSSKT